MRRRSSFFAALFFICATLSFPAPYPLFKLGAWIALALCAGRYISQGIVFGLLAFFGLLEALLGFFQFASHRSLGLGFLGEPVLDPMNGAVARTFVSGGRLMRAYGTFPHPNILAAFLVLALAAWAHLFLAHRRPILFLPGIFIVLLGLILTFSRSGWVAACIAIFLILIDARTRVSARTGELILVFALSLFVLLPIFSWGVFPRLSVGARDYAITERVSGYKAALLRIGTHPAFGGGLTLRMAPDPAHSLYLTVLDEIGIVGLIAFLLFVFYALLRGIYAKLAGLRTFAAMLVALLAMGVIDHFLWTLRPGIAMLFLVIGMLAFSCDIPSHS